MRPLLAMVELLLVASCGVPAPSLDVLPEYHNREVTALVEDCESVRLALGAAWDDALACRDMAGYLRPWGEAGSADAAEAVVREWLILGPVPIPEDRKVTEDALPNESRLAPSENERTAQWAWKKVTANTAYVDFTTLLGKATSAAGGRLLPGRHILHCGMPLLLILPICVLRFPHGSFVFRMPSPAAWPRRASGRRCPGTVCTHSVARVLRARPSGV